MVQLAEVATCWSKVNVLPREEAVWVGMWTDSQVTGPVWHMMYNLMSSFPQPMYLSQELIWEGFLSFLLFLHYV